MKQQSFDSLARTLADLKSRRQTLRSLASAGLGLGVLWRPADSEAKKKHKRKKRKVKKARPNEFGCLEVGDPCGSEDQCCSGVCEGKKGKRTCRAHDTGTCKQDGQLVPCNNRTNCGCFTTTAASDVCAELFPPSDCADCRRDTECEALGFPVGSSCIPYDCPSGFACMVPCGKAPPA